MFEDTVPLLPKQPRPTKDTHPDSASGGISTAVIASVVAVAFLVVAAVIVLIAVILRRSKHNGNETELDAEPIPPGMEFNDNTIITESLAILSFENALTDSNSGHSQLGGESAADE
jgi:hypothetical protein